MYIDIHMPWNSTAGAQFPIPVKFTFLDIIVNQVCQKKRWTHAFILVIIFLQAYALRMRLVKKCLQFLTTKVVCLTLDSMHHIYFLKRV